MKTPCFPIARESVWAVALGYLKAARGVSWCVLQAAAQAPAIIFLDELDGLVPARGQAGSGGSDQIYASVVSTMLALMDGVADRGAVVVIGATNR